MSSTQGETVLSNVTVDCHVRPPALSEPVDAHVELLRSYERDGRIDRLRLRSWPESVRLDTETPYDDVLERFEAFETWAERRGVSVRPPFEVRECSSSFTGEFIERLMTPLVCLALYDDEALVGVYPHSVDGQTYTVEDAIATLRAGEIPVPLGDPTDRLEECPDCGDQLLERRGLFACTTCGWARRIHVDGEYGRHDDRGVSSSVPH